MYFFHSKAKCNDLLPITSLAAKSPAQAGDTFSTQSLFRAHSFCLAQEKGLPVKVCSVYGLESGNNQDEYKTILSANNEFVSLNTQSFFCLFCQYK